MLSSKKGIRIRMASIILASSQTRSTTSTVSPESLPSTLEALETTVVVPPLTCKDKKEKKEFY